MVLPLMAIVLTTIGCDSNRQPAIMAPVADSVATSQPADNDSAAIARQLEAEHQMVLDRVEGIFRVVKTTYMNNGHYVMDESLDKTYCSKAWNKLLMAVRRKEEQTNTLFFEVDYWVMTHELGVIGFEEFEVDSLTIGSDSTRRATVSYTVFDANSYVPAKIDLIVENGQWVIDNFYNLKYLRDARQSMREYLVKDNLH